MATGDKDPTSFEVDRHVDEQPPREDLLEPEEIGPGDRDELEDLDEDDPRVGDAELLPDTEDLPESQGADVVEADRLAEDHAERPGLSDEEE